MIHPRLASRLTVIWLAAAAAPALAHSGHPGSGFMAGLTHPLTGIDHLGAMVLVGVWAGLSFPRAWWVCCASFSGFMLVGFGYGAIGGQLPIAEVLIVASLAVLGLALLLRARPPLAVAATILAVLAVGHGFAHGSEMPVGSDRLGFVTGFTATTALLQLTGLALARWRWTHARQLAPALGIVAMATAAMLWPT